MQLKELEIAGFKSFAKKSAFEFTAPISAVVGPNGSGKSNVAEAVRFVLGEQSLKSLRGKRGEDLIFGGSKQLPRAAHAQVTIVFDNSGRELAVDFDEVAVAREVARDGSNRYFINGSQVRLKDILELLSAVNIGATGHHIISQGEADRILNASPKDRRSMLEEALGLKVYQWKIAESEKKLNKTEEHIKEAESLRREIAPHVRYLKKQVEKIEQARQMREDLKERYLEYLKREETYLRQQNARLTREKEGPTQELRRIDDALAELNAKLSGEGNKADEKTEQKLADLRALLRDVRGKKDDLSRKLGRIEGLIEYKESAESSFDDKRQVHIDAEEVRALLSALARNTDEAFAHDDLGAIRRVLEMMRAAIADFEARVFSGNSAQKRTREDELVSLKQKQKELSDMFAHHEKEERRLLEEEQDLQRAMEQERESMRTSEREMYELRSKRTELLSRIHGLEAKEEALARDKRDFAEEVREAIVLVGEGVKEYTAYSLNEEAMLHEPRKAQEDRRKVIERIKIRLEDAGAGSGEDVMREYEEVVKRDRFLESEVADLRESAESLRELIVELEEKINADFKEGVKKINGQFQEFFSLMFGGGKASLEVVRQQKHRRKPKDEDLEALAEAHEEGGPAHEEETEEGVDVRVSLPHKKIKGLVMLSGGERALTSIALLFAVSQVNPPPFLILDETDAALDEANSRKYGQMLENLSKYSQLIVITHNRETMSHAGILYGVTMGADAASKILSVKFEEAQKIAK